MDNIGDWIYIVLFAVFGINALVGTLLKKKPENQTSRPTAGEIEFDPDTLWEPETEEPVENPVARPEENSTFVPVNPIVSKKETHNQYQPLTELRKTEQPTSPVVQLENTDDLKKAIICSEILNRKY